MICEERLPGDTMGMFFRFSCMTVAVNGTMLMGSRLLSLILESISMGVCVSQLLDLGGEGHAVVWQVRFLSVFLYILLYYSQIYICNQPVQSIAFWQTLLCNYIPMSSTFLAYDSKLYYMAIDDLYNILLNKQCLLYANACFIQKNKCSRSCIYCFQQ